MSNKCIDFFAGFPTRQSKCFCIFGHMKRKTMLYIIFFLLPLSVISCGNRKEVRFEVFCDTCIVHFFGEDGEFISVTVINDYVTSFTAVSGDALYIHAASPFIAEVDEISAMIFIDGYRTRAGTNGFYNFVELTSEVP